jgi:hypothetical protein
MVGGVPVGHIDAGELKKGDHDMSKKNHGGGHKSGGHNYGGHDRADKDCKTDPKPDPTPAPAPDDNDCKPTGGGNDVHHAAVISAGVDADVSANVLHCGSVLNVDADIDAHVGVDLGHDSWHA